MKTHFSTLTLVLCIAFSVCIFACSDTTITVTGANGRVFKSYQEACAAQDFTAAHQYLSALRILVDRYHGKSGRWNDEKYLHYLDLLEEGEKYVYKNEALFIMGMDDDDFIAKRLVFLLKEAGDYGNDSRCDMLIDIAIDMDKENIVKSLPKLYKYKISESTSKKLVDYLYLQKGKENLNFVSTLLDQNDRMSVLINTAIEHGDDKLATDLAKRYGNCIELDNKSFISKLASKKNRILSDAIIKSLSAVTISGSPYPIGLHDYYDAYRDRGQDDWEKSRHYRYADNITKYNNQCNNLLDIAIASGNQYLAQKVLTCFKEKPVFLTGSGSVIDKTAIKAPNGTWVDGDHSYLYYSNEDKKAAQKKYRETVIIGAFK